MSRHGTRWQRWHNHFGFEGLLYHWQVMLWVRRIQHSRRMQSSYGKFLLPPILPTFSTFLCPVHACSCRPTSFPSWSYRVLSPARRRAKEARRRSQRQVLPPAGLRRSARLQLVQSQESRAITPAKEARRRSLPPAGLRRSARLQLVRSQESHHIILRGRRR